MDGTHFGPQYHRVTMDGIHLLQSMSLSYIVLFIYIMDMDLTKTPYYILFLFLFISAQSFSMWGQYVTLPYNNLTMWEAYKMAIPYAWLDWFIMTFAVMVGHKYELVSPTQDTFLLIIIQFCLILIINQYYLKQKVTVSDIIAFFIILFGFFVSFLHLISKLFSIPVPEHPGTDNPDEASSILKVGRYLESG